MQSLLIITIDLTFSCWRPFGDRYHIKTSPLKELLKLQ